MIREWNVSLPAIELKRIAYRVLDYAGINAADFGLNRIDRIASRFAQRPDAGAWTFFLYFSGDVLHMDKARCARIIAEHPDLAPHLAHSDFTVGEKATRHVHHERGW